MEMSNSNWNRRLLVVLNRTSIKEVGLIAARDVNAALSYEQRLIGYKIAIEKEEATCYEQMAQI
jgi:hypothetical protein